tara:strand:+ start:15309 stop:17312 length:2004 start_codon:yes stop_codon:yes gene_type:complete
MKDSIININLQTTTSPIVQEVRGKDWIEFGTEDWRNLFPQFMIDLYYSSSITAAIINATAEYISAEDLIIEDEDDRDMEARVKLQNFMDRANSNESLHEVLKKVAFDFKLQGAFALNVVWSKDRTQIAEIYHLGVEKLRCERPDEMGKTNGYFICADWSNTRQNKPYYVPAFNVNDRTSPNQILYAGVYSPNMNSYYTPDYVSCNNWSLIDSKVSEFHLNNISNGFSGSFMLNFSNGIPTQEERLQIEQSLTEKFTGTNSGKFILTFSDDKTRTPEINAITPSDLDKQYLALQELLTANICSGHRITSKTLMGLDSANGFSNNADELNSAANFYLNTVVKGFQDIIVKQLRKIFKVNQMDMPVQFVQLKPITTRFTNQDLMAVMTQDEIREELGLEPLDTDVEVREDFSKVGVVDGKPVFSTIEEAEAHAKTLGCEGYHEHSIDGKIGYMACKDHKEVTVLDTFLSTMEDIPKDWELINEEVVDGEHRDFDYETELNATVDETLNLDVSTGRANPNARSSQDGLNKKKTAFYKVRYVYANDNFLENKSKTHREFCTKMMEAKKIYRKEDIDRMSKLKGGANPGFGIDGANNYDIFLYKGGPQCFHFWLRQIYKAPKTDDNYVYYPDNVQDEKNIGYTKAKSEGFTAKRNDKLVAIPPRRMKNHGYYN